MASTVVAAVPIMLLGALSVLLQPDIELDEARLGAGVSVYFLFAGLSSVVGGRLAERMSSQRTVRFGLFVSAFALFSIGALAQEWWHIVGALVLAGTATGFIHPAVNLVLARRVPGRLQGILFGAKQSAVPTAALIAGLSVPVFGGLGWRWAFVSAAFAAALVSVLVPSWSRDGAVAPPSKVAIRLPYKPVLLASAGGALASGAANAMAIFFVLFGASVGMTVEFAAGLLVVASLAGILARILAGIAAGRMGRTPFALVASMVGVGAVGYLTLAVAPSPLYIGLGLTVGFVAGWGWPGVMLLGVIRVSPQAPAAASGIVQGATFIGAILGPATFGLVAAGVSYEAAWTLMSGGAGVGALLIARAASTARSTIHTAAHVRAPLS